MRRAGYRRRSQPRVPVRVRRRGGRSSRRRRAPAAAEARRWRGSWSASVSWLSGWLTSRSVADSRRLRLARKSPADAWLGEQPLGEVRRVDLDQSAAAVTAIEQVLRCEVKGTRRLHRDAELIGLIGVGDGQGTRAERTQRLE